MADKLITGLVYGHHVPPPRKRPLKDRLKLPVAIGLFLIVTVGLGYKYINYREEGIVREFLDRIQAGNYDAAYASWDPGPTYHMKEFLEDWGPNGQFTRGAKEIRVVTSHRAGAVVNVRVSTGASSKPIELRVDKETLKVVLAPSIR